MKKNLLLYILLFFLIGVNGFFLYNFLGNSNKQGNSHKKPKPPQAFLIKELKFDESQKAEFHKISKATKEKMDVISSDIRSLKENYFNLIILDSVKMQTVDSIATLISKKEKEKELNVFERLQSIKNICNEKQLKKFKVIMKDAMHRHDRRDNLPPHERRNGPPPRH